MPTIHSLFTGVIKPLPPDGQPSAIYKTPVTGPVAVGWTGLEGDQQADHRYHGGPEKAVHHYPAENYPLLETLLQQPAGWLLPGILGENISSHDWNEHAACIGDVYAAGAVRLQVSQPRSPCWKINRRLEHDGVSRVMVESGLTGWYYRVLACGVLSPGMELELLEREQNPVSVACFVQQVWSHRPEMDALARFIRIQGLAPDWKQRLQQRQAWLSQQKPG